MAFTPLHSAQYLNSIAKPRVFVSGADWGGKLEFAMGSLTLTAASNGTAKFFTLPAGKKIILPDLSRIVIPEGTTLSDAHIGHTAYVQPDGTAVPAAVAAFGDNIDAGAAVDQAWPLPAVGYFVLDSIGSVDIELLIDTADTAASGEIMLYCAYAVVGK